jgi:hypothetical protein
MVVNSVSVHKGRTEIEGVKNKVLKRIFGLKRERK